MWEAQTEICMPLSKRIQGCLALPHVAGWDANSPHPIDWAKDDQGSFEPRLKRELSPMSDDSHIV
jgi:hypothetical protein